MIESESFKISIDQRSIEQESSQTKNFGLKAGYFQLVEIQLQLIEPVK